MEIEVKENDYTCGNCKHYDPDECYCQASGKFELYSLDSCDEWEDEDELSDDEKREIVGDRECHRRMVEGDEIEE